MASDRKILAIAQEDPLIEIPGDRDLFEMGTIGQVLQIMRLHNGTIKALFEAHQRGRLVEARMGEPYYTGVVEPVEEIDEETPEMVALSKMFAVNLSAISKTSRNTPKELRNYQLKVIPLIDWQIESRLYSTWICNVSKSCWKPLTTAASGNGL